MFASRASDNQQTATPSSVVCLRDTASPQKYPSASLVLELVSLHLLMYASVVGRLPTLPEVTDPKACSIGIREEPDYIYIDIYIYICMYVYIYIYIYVIIHTST